MHLFKWHKLIHQRKIYLYKVSFMWAIPSLVTVHHMPKVSKTVKKTSCLHSDSKIIKRNDKKVHHFLSDFSSSKSDIWRAILNLNTCMHIRSTLWNKYQFLFLFFYLNNFINGWHKKHLMNYHLSSRCINFVHLTDN